MELQRKGYAPSPFAAEQACYHCLLVFCWCQLPFLSSSEADTKTKSAERKIFVLNKLKVPPVEFHKNSVMAYVAFFPLLSISGDA